jgi:hypothetical protein
MATAFRRSSEILADVLNVATFVTTTPAAAFGHAQKLAALRAEVAAVISRPAPDGRVIDDLAAILMTAAIHIAGHDWKQPRWLELAQFLLPYIRDDWRAAIEQELRPLEPERPTR